MPLAFFFFFCPREKEEGGGGDSGGMGWDMERREGGKGREGKEGGKSICCTIYLFVYFYFYIFWGEGRKFFLIAFIYLFILCSASNPPTLYYRLCTSYTE